MIIKKKRVRARGPALKRFIRHVRDGEDNDAIEVLRGNFADLEDARADALRFCREYAIRAWSMSPERKLTDEQIEDMVNRMAREFGFDPKKCMLIRHTKPRAIEEKTDSPDTVPTDEHYHLLVPEVNPLDGGVLSNAHDYARHEKLSLAMEVAWGHRAIPGPHLLASLSIFAKEAPSVADKLSTASPTDHPAAFEDSDHQRLKRAGLDLPSLRVKISEAIAHASDRSDFDARMFAIGLRVCPGKKAGILVVETTSDSVFIGSLARLTRLRQEALDQRMKFHGPSQKAEAHDSRSDLRAVETSHRSIGAGIATDDGKLGDGWLPADARHPDRTAAPDSGGDRTFAREDRRPREQVGRNGSCESLEKRYPQLRLALGLNAHKGVLLDMLGIARRSALPLLQRADLNLLDVIEEETAIIRHLENPREPATLIAARNSFDADTLALQFIQAKIDAARQARDSLAPLSAWDRMFGSAQKLARQNADKRLLSLEHKGAEARDRRAASGRLLTAEVKKFESAKAGAEADIFKRVAAGRSRIETARVGRKLIENNSHFARWSVVAVLRLAAIIQRNRSDMREEQPEEWDLVPSYDIWGIPILPRPKSP